MAVNPVSLAETLRPWRFAGITHFLRDEELLALTEPYLLPEDKDCLQENSEKTLSPNKDAYSTGKPPASVTVSLQAPNRPLKYTVTQEEKKEASQTVLQLDPTAWPAPWQAAFAKVGKAPLLWSYNELGADLGGKAEPARSACLRTIIGNLHLPKGSSAFWAPALLSSSGNLILDKQIFLSGVQLINPKILILIGPSAVEHFDDSIALSVPFTQQIDKGRLFVLLPEFSALLAANSLVEKSVIYLRACFNSIPALFPRE